MGEELKILRFTSKARAWIYEEGGPYLCMQTLFLKGPLRFRNIIFHLNTAEVTFPVSAKLDNRNMADYKTHVSL